MSSHQKVALITGASQGIGAGLVKGFRDRNYRVIATSRTIKASDDPDILTVAGDIGSADTAQRIISQGLERFGRVDTLSTTRESSSRSRSRSTRRPTSC